MSELVTGTDFSKKITVLPVGRAPRPTEHIGDGENISVSATTNPDWVAVTPAESPGMPIETVMGKLQAVGDIVRSAPYEERSYSEGPGEGDARFELQIPKVYGTDGKGTYFVEKARGFPLALRRSRRVDESSKQLMSLNPRYKVLLAGLYTKFLALLHKNGLVMQDHKTDSIFIDGIRNRFSPHALLTIADVSGVATKSNKKLMELWEIDSQGTNYETLRRLYADFFTRGTEAVYDAKNHEFSLSTSYGVPIGDLIPAHAAYLLLESRAIAPNQMAGLIDKYFNPRLFSRLPEKEQQSMDGQIHSAHEAKNRLLEAWRLEG